MKLNEKIADPPAEISPSEIGNAGERRATVPVPPVVLVWTWVIAMLFAVAEPVFVSFTCNVTVAPLVDPLTV